MQTPLLILLFMLLGHSSSVLAQDRDPAPEFRFRQRGGPFPDGTVAGVVQRRRGLKTQFDVVTFKDGGFTVKGPRKDNKGSAMTWFVVVGLTKLEQFEDFLDHPENWTWAQFPATVGRQYSRELPFFWKGQVPLVRGRVLGPGGKPLDYLRVNCWRVSDKEKNSEVQERVQVGHDPCTGRFWGLQIRGRSTVAEAYRLDFIPYLTPALAHPNLAKVFRVAWQKQKEQTVSIPVAGRIHGKVLGLEKLSFCPYFTVSLEMEGVGWVDDLPIRGAAPFDFRGLPEGRFVLRVRAEDNKKPVFEKTHVVLNKGQALQLPTVDIREFVKPVQISILDSEGVPLLAKIQFLRSQAWRGESFPMRFGSSVQILAKAGFVFPQSGLPLIVSAPGMGTRVFKNVSEDLEVVMTESLRINLKLVGIDEHPHLLENLHLLAQPTAGYPEWAWQALVPGLSQPPRGRRRQEVRSGSVELPVLNSVARLEDKDTGQMDIPYPGKWKFELAYIRDRRVVRLPLPNLQSIDILLPGQHIRVEIPRPILIRARAKFEKLKKR